MRAFYQIANVAIFAIFAQQCGKSIDRRDWEKSVAYFLGALGLVLLFVKNFPPLD